jgi:hypothetical protein
MPEPTQQLRERIQQQQKPQQAISPEPIYSQPPTLKPNPYEEKFHSEFCFISLILGIFGLILPLFSTLAIIFGIGGLMQTHREHMKGKWMGITGITLGFLGILLVIIAILLGVQFLEELMFSGNIEAILGGLAENFIK